MLNARKMTQICFGKDCLICFKLTRFLTTFYAERVEQVEWVEQSLQQQKSFSWHSSINLSPKRLQEILF